MPDNFFNFQNKKSKRLGSRGFGLVEMILYVAICSVLLLSLSSLYFFLLTSRIKSQIITEVEQQGQQIIQLITYTTRNARTIDIPSIGVTGTSLSLTVQNGMLSPTIFDVSASGTMRIQEGSGPQISLTNSHVSVGSPLFQNVSSASSSDRMLRFSFTIRSNNISGRNEYEYTKSFTGSASLRQ